MCGDVPGARARSERAGRGPAACPRCQLARGRARAPAAGHPLRADGPRAERGGRTGRGGGGAALGRVPGVRPVRLRARHPARRLHRRCHGLGRPPPGPRHLRQPPRDRPGGGTPPRPGPVRRGPPQPGRRGEPPGVELAAADRGGAAARGGVGRADRPRPPGRRGTGARPRRVHGRREVERPRPRRDADRHRPHRHHGAGPPRALGPPALRRLGAQDRGPGRRPGRPAAAPPARPARRPPAPPPGGLPLAAPARPARRADRPHLPARPAADAARRRPGRSRRRDVAAAHRRRRLGRGHPGRRPGRPGPGRGRPRRAPPRRRAGEQAGCGRAGHRVDPGRGPPRGHPFPYLPEPWCPDHF